MFESEVSHFAIRVNAKLPIADKTGHLYKQLARENSALIIGPKGFGKTLNLTTMMAILGKWVNWSVMEFRNTKQRNGTDITCVRYIAAIN